MFNFLSLHWCFHHLPWRETIKWKDSRSSLMVSTQPWKRWCEVRIHGKDEMIINSHWKFTHISEWVRVRTQIIAFNITISTFLLVELRFVDYTLFFYKLYFMHFPLLIIAFFITKLLIGNIHHWFVIINLREKSMVHKLYILPLNQIFSIHTRFRDCTCYHSDLLRVCSLRHNWYKLM